MIVQGVHGNIDVSLAAFHHRVPYAEPSLDPTALIDLRRKYEMSRCVRYLKEKFPSIAW
ncbi:hypothetical protein ACFYTG_08970 [Streptomyces mirabilis]|uniref:hypothetical protein n=1 Tax=Streptomyces mirabilis TaxID=68239 RepID=UPI0036A35934